MQIGETQKKWSAIYLFILVGLFFSISANAQTEIPTTVDIVDPDEQYIIFDNIGFVDNDTIQIDFDTTFEAICDIAYSGSVGSGSYQEIDFFLNHIVTLDIREIEGDIIDYEILCQINDPTYDNLKEETYTGSIERPIFPITNTETNEDTTEGEDLPELESYSPDEDNNQEEYGNEDPGVNDTELPISLPKTSQEAYDMSIDLYDLFRDFTKKYAPAVLLTAIALTSLINLIMNPYMIVYGFLWFKNKKKKHAYGLVFDTQTRSPIPFVLIQVLDQSNNLANRTVTSSEGRYLLLLDKGKYKIKIEHPNYKNFEKEIKIAKKDTAITDIFGLSKEASILAKARVQFFDIFKVINKYIYRIGLVWSLFALYITITAINIIIVLIYLLQVIVSFTSKAPRNWGYVFDQETKERLPKVFIQLFNIKTNTTIDTQITDTHGRFGFTLSEGNYDLFVNSQKYKLSNNNFNLIEKNNYKFIQYSPEQKKVEKIGLINQKGVTELDNPFA